MKDFFDTIVLRAMAVEPSPRPIVAPVFAPGPSMAGEDIADSEGITPVDGAPVSFPSLLSPSTTLTWQSPTPPSPVDERPGPNRYERQHDGPARLDDLSLPPAQQPERAEPKPLCSQSPPSPLALITLPLAPPENQVQPRDDSVLYEPLVGQVTQAPPWNGIIVDDRPGPNRYERQHDGSARLDDSSLHLAQQPEHAESKPLYNESPLSPLARTTPPLVPPENQIRPWDDNVLYEPSVEQIIQAPLRNNIFVDDRPGPNQYESQHDSPVCLNDSSLLLTQQPEYVEPKPLRNESPLSPLTRATSPLVPPENQVRPRNDRILYKPPVEQATQAPPQNSIIQKPVKSGSLEMQTMRPSSTEPSPAIPIIKVSIGRVDVRAVNAPVSPSTKRAVPAIPQPSLGEYLQARNRGKR